MYRPQFPYATPPGCRDEEFTYHFDGLNTPMLLTPLNGIILERVPLVLDQDAPFYWRGWKFGPLRNEIASIPVLAELPDVDLKLRDCYDNDLQDNWVPATQYGFAQNPLQFNLSMLTGPPVLIEPEIYCPRGGVILAWIRGTRIPSGEKIADRLPSGFTFYGVKRFQECDK